MGKSVRRMTRQQFSQGTTADGNRLDRAFADAVDRANAFDRRDLARGHVQTQMVLGWAPAITAKQDKLPFMDGYNDSNSLVGAAPDGGYQNPYRVKGTVNTGIDPTDPAQDALVWTTSVYFRKPVTLDGLSLHLRVDSAYLNDLIFSGGLPPDGKTAGAPLDDIVLSVAVDNPYAPEVAAHDAVEVHKLQWKVDGTPYSTLPIGVGTDGVIIHPGGRFVGVAVDERALGIPIPRDSRVRLAICIPLYPAGKTSGWTAGVRKAWNNQIYSSVLTMLEPIEE